MVSGLILLVIVGAWLAVLVPMGLRAHDGAAPSRSAERLGDAVRVLSRRRTAALDAMRGVGGSVPAEEATAGDELDDRDDDEQPRRTAYVVLRDLWRARAARRAPRSAPRRRRQRRAVTLAVRRRRVLLTLLGSSGVLLGAGLAGPSVFVVGSAGLAVLALGYVVGCRRQTVHRARVLRARRAAEQRSAAAVVPVPRRRPAARTEPEPVDLLEPAPVTVTVSEPVRGAVGVSEPVRGAVGEPWQPVPVPLPSYVGKAVAPQPVPRAPRQEPLGDEGVQPDAILERRRAVGGW